MKSLSIKRKLFLAFSTILFLTGVVGLQSRKGLSDAEEIIQKANGVREVTDMINRLRNYQKDYLLTKDEKYARQMEEGVQEVFTVGDKTTALFVDQVNVDQMEQIKKTIKDYENTFLTYVELEEKKSGNDMRS